MDRLESLRQLMISRRIFARDEESLSVARLDHLLEGSRGRWLVELRTLNYLKGVEVSKFANHITRYLEVKYSYLRMKMSYVLDLPTFIMCFRDVGADRGFLGP